MDQQRLFLRDIAGTHALDCWLALTLLGPLPVTTHALLEVMGQRMSYKRLLSGLEKLSELDMIVRAGSRNAYTWQLRQAGFGFQLPIPVDRIKAPVEAAETSTSSANAEPLRGPQDQATPFSLVTENGDDPAQGKSFSPIRENGAGVQDPLNAGVSTPFSLVRENGALKEGGNELKNILFLSFHAAEILPHLRESLARRLLADDAEFWARRGVLGHIAGYCAFRGRTRRPIGAIVFPALKRLERPAPEFLPPEGLPFDAALHWALRGGQPEPEPAPGLLEQAEAYPPLPPGAEIWEAARARLKLELTKPVYDDWVRPLAFRSWDGGVLALAAPSAYVRDVVVQRLLGRIEQAAQAAAGHAVAVAVRITLDGGTPGPAQSV